MSKYTNTTFTCTLYNIYLLSIPYTVQIQLLLVPEMGDTVDIGIVCRYQVLIIDTNFMSSYLLVKYLIQVIHRTNLSVRRE